VLVHVLRAPDVGMPCFGSPAAFTSALNSFIILRSSSAQDLKGVIDLVEPMVVIQKQSVI
jgi:hypothetical protein